MLKFKLTLMDVLVSDFFIFVVTCNKNRVQGFIKHNSSVFKNKRLDL